MPIYVYRNLTTGEIFEVEQRMTDAALSEHPETGDPVKRLIQPVGIAFKGSGFYVTDSRSKGTAAKGNGSAGNGSTESADSPVKSDGAADSKGASAGSDGAGATASDSSKGESKSAVASSDS